MWAPIHSKADFAKYGDKLRVKALLMFDHAPLTLHTVADRSRPQRMRKFWPAEAAVEGVAAGVPQQPPVLRAVALQRIATRAAGGVPVKAHGSTRRRRLPWPMPRTRSCATRSTCKKFPEETAQCAKQVAPHVRKLVYKHRSYILAALVG